MKISGVPFRHGQRDFCQRGISKAAGDRAPFRKPRRIFVLFSFTLGLHLSDSMPGPAEINQIVSSVNVLGPFRGTLPYSFPLASWNQDGPTTRGSSEQRRTRGAQPILPLFVLTLCCWLTAGCSRSGLGGTAGLPYIGLR